MLRFSLLSDKFGFYQLYMIFLEESHNPLRIKSLCGLSKNEVTSWQLFWFLHTCINCVNVQLTLCKSTIFYGTCKTPLIFLFSNRQKQISGFISRSQRWYSLFTIKLKKNQAGLKHAVTVVSAAIQDSPYFPTGGKVRRQSRCVANLPRLRRAYLPRKPLPPSKVRAR